MELSSLRYTRSFSIYKNINRSNQCYHHYFYFTQNVNLLMQQTDLKLMDFFSWNKNKELTLLHQSLHPTYYPPSPLAFLLTPSLSSLLCILLLLLQSLLILLPLLNYYWNSLTLAFTNLQSIWAGHVHRNSSNNNNQVSFNNFYPSSQEFGLTFSQFEYKISTIKSLFYLLKPFLNNM